MSDFSQDPFDFPSDFVERVMFSRQKKPVYFTIPYGQLDPQFADLVLAPTIIPYGQLDPTLAL